MARAGRAAAARDTAAAHIDVNGLGAGVYDRLYELCAPELRVPHNPKTPPH